MHKFVCFNRRLISAENACLSVFSSAALYGKSVFTTIAVFNRKPFQWEKHWRRLRADAEKIRVDLSALSEQSIKIALAEVIAANKFENGRARVTLFDESSARIWQPQSKTETSFSIQTADFLPVLSDFRLTVSPFPVNSKSPLAGVKCGNYLENILALEKAKTENFDEAIRLNERGEIVSASAANVFWTKSGAIFTASPETGCLPGTTRAFVTENFPVTETAARFGEILEADEVFLTSAGIGIVKVESIGSTIFSGASVKTVELKNFFRNFTNS